MPPWEFSTIIRRRTVSSLPCRVHVPGYVLSVCSNVSMHELCVPVGYTLRGHHFLPPVRVQKMARATRLGQCCNIMRPGCHLVGDTIQFFRPVGFSYSDRQAVFRSFEVLQLTATTRTGLVCNPNISGSPGGKTALAYVQLCGSHVGCIVHHLTRSRSSLCLFYQILGSLLLWCALRGSCAKS